MAAFRWLGVVAVDAVAAADVVAAVAAAAGVAGAAGAVAVRAASRGAAAAFANSQAAFLIKLTEAVLCGRVRQGRPGLSFYFPCEAACVPR